MSAPPAGGAAGGAAPTATESEEEQVLAACRDGDARGMSQDQLVAALPSIHVLRVSECLNSLLTKARGRAAAALRCSRAAAAPQGRIQVYSAAGAPSPPAPTIRTRAAFSLCWPGPPTSRRTRCRA